MRRSATSLIAVGIAFIALSVSGSPARSKPIAYPSDATAPANLLRIHVRLDAPLARPLEAGALHLEDGEGRLIPNAFYDVAVLSRDNLTVTILMHPGRIKSGLAANAALGRALTPGRIVTLRGTGALDGLSQSWRVTPALSTALDISTWAIAPPRSGTRAALTVAFDRSIDAEAAAYLAVADAEGVRVAGEGALDSGERTWRFTPADPWAPDAYTLRVHPNLEDVAGNRLCAPFELIGLSHIECGPQSLAWTPRR